MNKLVEYIAAIFMVVLTINSAMAEQAVVPVYELGDVQGTFVQVPLTHDIYRYARHRDLRDLRVQDAELNALPYRIVTVPFAADKTEPKNISSALTFFPVAVDATPDTLRKLHTSQTKMQDGQVQITTSDKLLDNKIPEFYLIDISKIDHDITSLLVDWNGRTEQGGSQYIEIELEATHNLQHWMSLGRFTLVQLTQEGQQLKHNEIPAKITKKQYEFLRLKIGRGAEQFKPTGVVAQQTTEPPAQQKNLSENWSVPGQPAQVQTSVYSNGKTQRVAAWEFTRDDVTPLESISIKLGGNIYGDSIKLFSRKTDKEEWKFLHQGIWFNALVGDNWHASDAIKVYSNNDKNWRLELNETAKNFQAPELVFSWQPLQLQIITNNKPPFSIAVTNENNATNQQVFNQLLATASPTWTSARLIKLNIDADAFVTSEEKIDLWQLLFWATLLIAVIVLVIFSLKLVKQLKVSES